jgi:hypothetical protein
MQTVSSIELHIAELEREIVQLKVARNALTSFGRVLAEVLLEVAHLTMTDMNRHASKELFSLTCASSQLRAVFLNTPKLWVTVDFNKMSKAWVDRCMAHAGLHPLVSTYTHGCEVQQGAIANKTLERVIRALPRCGTCYFNATTNSVATLNLVIQSLLKSKPPVLQTLSLSSDVVPHLSPDFAQLGRLTALSTLRLTRVAIDALPYLPNPSTVNLEFTCCPIRKLYQFFSSSLKLHTVILEYAVKRDSARKNHCGRALGPIFRCSSISRLKTQPLALVHLSNFFPIPAHPSRSWPSLVLPASGPLFRSHAKLLYLGSAGLP